MLPSVFLAYMYMRSLELFSGTGSVGSAFAAAGWTIISLDSDPKTDAAIHEDILTWDYTIYPPGHFDAVWASPCCTHYSLRPTWCQNSPKSGLGGLPGSSEPGNYKLF